MATCTDGKGGGCRRPITQADKRDARVVRNDAGKVVGILHKRCYFVLFKRSREGQTHEGTPSPYEMSLSKRTATDLTEEAQERRRVAHERLAQAEADREILRSRMATFADQEALSYDINLKTLMDEHNRAVLRAQEEAHLADHQADLAAERAKEDERGIERDWRDPTTEDI